MYHLLDNHYVNETITLFHKIILPFLLYIIYDNY